MLAARTPVYRATGNPRRRKRAWSMNLADQADVVMGRENNTAILADLEARYDTILAALARIGKGKYGTCEVCGETIEEARLEANPSATVCIKHL